MSNLTKPQEWFPRPLRPASQAPSHGKHHDGDHIKPASQAPSHGKHHDGDHIKPASQAPTPSPHA